MIRRNTADQFVLLGPLLSAADGTAQTSGAAVTVLPDGTAAAGAGTLTHVDGGVWKYTPTAAETDCAVLGFVLTKAGAVSSPCTAVTTRFPTQSELTLTDGGVVVNSLDTPAADQIEDLLAAGAAGMTTETVLLTITTPSDQITDGDANQLTEITVGQALTALLVSLVGDRSGVGTREITAALPGIPGATVTATRVSRAAISSSLVLPAAG